MRQVQSYCSSGNDVAIGLVTMNLREDHIQVMQFRVEANIFKHVNYRKNSDGNPVKVPLGRAVMLFPERFLTKKSINCD